MPKPKTFHGPAVYKSYISNGRVRAKKVRRKKKRSFAEAVRDAIGEEQWQADFGDLSGPSASRHTAKKPSTNLPYTEKKKRAEKEWAECRQAIIFTMVESQMELPQNCCVEMCTAYAMYHCHDCGSRMFYCENHVRTYHQGKLHVPELVKDGACYPTMVQQEPWKSDGHLSTCASEHVRHVTVVDRKGRQHDIPVVFCQCHSAVVTLLKLGLWAATPKRPVVAFDIALMEWMRVMFVECQLSLWSICQALPWLSSPHLQQKIKSAYTHLAFNSFTEYRVIKSMLWQQTFRPGTSIECPACPKSAGRKIVSLDAVFGLKRWKKSGSSVCPPRHGDVFFINQQVVDSFIKTYDHGTNKTAETECSQFQANDSMRSKVKTAKVDETGVFGAVCRHEMPVKFFSLRQGEKLSNSVFLIQTILGTQNNTVELFVLYDIACKLKSHLKSRASFSQDSKRLLEKIQLAVPAFHVYAHKPDCQLSFSPRRTKGFGLTDGEQVERLWSVLRNFSHITKEMTPSNRIDALTDALIHHTQKTKHKMVPLLMHRYKKASDMKTAADKELLEALQGTPGLKEEDIRSWVLEDIINPLPPSSVTAISMTKKEEYFLKLKEFYSLEIELQECAAAGVNSGHVELLSRNLRRLHTELSAWEDGQQRWSSTSTQYLEQMKINDDRKRCLALHNLHNTCVERWFLILMKKRYADVNDVPPLQFQDLDISEIFKVMMRDDPIMCPVNESTSDTHPSRADSSLNSADSAASTISTNVTQELNGSEHQSTPADIPELPGSISLEEYYAVYYDRDYYIGRAIGRDGDNFKFKFMHRHRHYSGANYDWPRRPDIEWIHKRYIIDGPLKLVGNGPFRVMDLDRVNHLYLEMRKLYK